MTRKEAILTGVAGLSALAMVPPLRGLKIPRNQTPRWKRFALS